MRSEFPPKQGLYDPANEHDSCGLNFVCDLKGRISHSIVQQAVGALCRLDHRGAKGAEINTGDGAGILLQVPDRLFREVVDFELPPAGRYATGIGFLPQSDDAADKSREEIERITKEEGLRVLGWRQTPVNTEGVGSQALVTMPQFSQVFIAGDGVGGIDLDRQVYVARKRFEREINLDVPVYFPSLSSRTITYKGMLTTAQLADFFPDLVDERCESALAIVHSRFSTNTFPAWPLAHPFRMVAHNGEINTDRGNRNWMRAREALLETDLIPGDISRILPICAPGGSDTAAFDEVLELLCLGGYSMPEAVMMMIPEPWENHESLSAERRAFYQYHASLMEPWDGPASIAFTDGSLIGAVLDRNGLRPSRYWVTDDDVVIMASEVGVVQVDSSKVIEKGRLQPGRMFLIDTDEGRIIRDDEIKEKLAAARPYQDWLDQNLVELDDIQTRSSDRNLLSDEATLLQQQQVFGYTLEEHKMILTPMATKGKEAIGSMGTDTPLAVLSDKSRLLYDYFKQHFAQVTNPPLDAIREQLITSVCSTLGPEINLLNPVAESCRQIYLPHPIITNDQLASLIEVDTSEGLEDFSTVVIPCLYEAGSGGAGLEAALTSIRAKASEAVADGTSILVLSDRGANENLIPIPSLLATSGVHHHLVRERTRTRVGLVVESGEARQVHHFAMLIGYGASAINPYLAFDALDHLISEDRYGLGQVTPQQARTNFVKSVDLGLLKVLSKMGISTVMSYTGAQIFEAIGLSHELVEEYFTGTSSKLDGIGLDLIAAELEKRHALAFAPNPETRSHRSLEVGGEYKWRGEGEHHLFNPETVFKLQHSTRSGRYDIFKEYTSAVDDQAVKLATLRGLIKLRPGTRPPVPLDQVEPASEIFKRFSTGAMSYGSISQEAHQNLAIAMNRIGGKSNTGEGGEDPDRFTPDENGDLRRSSIKQVASGRFGVTSEYLVNSDDIQIKMAQGAKPGEGGQLPGNKVWPWIAKTRHSTPGVGLISPPPHHDIYSIEDLAQLIFDLKNANPEARVHVKLVSEVGVGTVAAGVSKAHADVVLISGHDGGTGAAALTSIKHAGTPWEIGLAETQQTLMLNDLRGRIVVQVDGQLKTGRDVVIAALLGADEFGFATAPLVVSGCIMMRVCHLDTCPVGVATQNPELRRKFSGKPEFVVNFFEYIAEEVREYLAELGFRSVEEAIGQVEALDVNNAIEHWKADGLDLSPILHLPDIAEDAPRSNVTGQDHGLEAVLDNTLIEESAAALDSQESVTFASEINNTDRSTGTMLGYQLTKKYGGAGLADDTIQIDFEGSAGNSFGAFVPAGVTMRLTGDANDFVGKGLSGARLIVKPPVDVSFVPEEQIIAGNVTLYGATAGELYVRGQVGERFCVRNSGAIAVVEGIGDHGCEYMTGGRAVVLGATGRNFAAGMSGGIAYVYDVEATFSSNVNMEMVALEELSADDKIWLQDRIRTHVTETESTLGQSLLDEWEQASAKFVKVMPTDFKAVLEAKAQAKADGTDEVAAIMAATQG